MKRFLEGGENFILHLFGWAVDFSMGAFLRRGKDLAFFSGDRGVLIFKRFLTGTISLLYFGEFHGSFQYSKYEYSFFPSKYYLY